MRFKVSVERRVFVGMKRYSQFAALPSASLEGTNVFSPAFAQAPAKQPNIIMIMGDDIGWANIGAYNQGVMSMRTPNLDRMAAEGMRFTDYYAEASCTAGRANFITGELPIRTGLTTVGQAGSPIGMPAQAPTIATALKSMGYATGQFGKNHLGDLNQFLPTLHGFDEFYGYLYHLDAMEDPCHPNYPQNLRATVGPRNMVHSWATTTDDATVMPRWGKVGKQKIEDAGRAVSETHGNRGRRDPGECLEVPRQGTARQEAVLPVAQPDAHARRHAPVTEVQRAAQLGQQLDHPGSRHGAARRHRRLGHEVPEGQRPRRRHHHRLHHRQRRRELHLARRRPDAVRWRQGHGARRGLPRPDDPALARQGAGGQGRERHHVRHGLVPHLRGRGRQREHHRRAAEGQAARRPDRSRCTWTATTRWT